jgi:two pore calcium channel protein 2
MIVVLIFRSLRAINYMLEFRDFQMIVTTFKNFAGPFSSMALTLYMFMQIYAVIGIYFFNGMVTRTTMLQSGSDYMYMMMNFNDFYAALLTLFQISVQNNWNNTTDIYTDISGSNWPRVYFVSYWVFSCMIVLNIVISFVLEIYSTVGDDIISDNLKLQYAKALMKMFPDEDKFVDYL